MKRIVQGTKIPLVLRAWRVV